MTMSDTIRAKPPHLTPTSGSQMLDRRRPRGVGPARVGARLDRRPDPSRSRGSPGEGGTDDPDQVVT
jgi:hypothetical protein